MAKYHDIDAEIWEELLDYSAKQILVYIYLFSNPLCRPSGLYRIRPETIKHHTKCGEDVLTSISGRLIEYDFETSEVWVRGKMKRILSGFKNNVQMRKSVKADFEALKSVFIKSLFISKYEGALEGLVSPPLPLPLPLPLSLNKDKEIKKKDAGRGLMDLWGEVCVGFPQPKEYSNHRATKCRARLEEKTLEQWREVFAKIKSSDFLRGNNARNWKASFDWIIDNDHNATKVLEGKYEGGNGGEKSGVEKLRELRAKSVS